MIGGGLVPGDRVFRLCIQESMRDLGTEVKVHVCLSAREMQSMDLPLSLNTVF